MRVMVTGGAGFIGSHVAETLVEEGHEVLIVDDLSTGKADNVPPGAVLAEGDIRDREFVRSVFHDFRPECVSHQAAQTSVSVSTREPVRDAEINVLGSLHVLEASIEAEVGHLIFASTGGAIYGEVPEGARAEVGWPTHPLTPYACSKLAIEGYLGAYRAMHGLRSTVLRYANVYGPRQDPHGEAGVVAIFSRRLVQGLPIHVNARRARGDAGCVRDYIYVDDVVRANVAAVAGRCTRPIVNVATGRPTTTLELARMLQRAMGTEADIVPGEKRMGDLEVSVLQPDDACPIGTATPLEEGLEATARYFRAQAP